jgi:hypothetical protein
LKNKNKHTLIRKSNPTRNKKKNTYHYPIFVEYKKTHINLFSLCGMKSKFKLEKRAKKLRTNILGSGCGAQSNTLRYGCAVRPKIDRSG